VKRAGRAYTGPRPVGRAKLEALREALAMPAVVVAREGIVVTVTLNNIETVNELNRREKSRFELAAMRKAQKNRVVQALAIAHAKVAMPPGLPARVVLVRLSEKRLDPLANLPSALKATEDGLCAFFKVDDGPDCPIDRACDQRVRRVSGVEIVLTWKPTPRLP
jgi:hypothetical protein